MTSIAVRRSTVPAYALVVAVGLVALAFSSSLPWQQEEFRLGTTLRWTMAAAGVLILAVGARAGSGGPAGGSLFVLGASVLAYPTLLSLAAADVGGPVISALGNAGHVLPLTMVQLIPVLVSAAVTGRSRRRWVTTVVAVAVVGAVATGVGLAAASGVLLAVGSVLWFVSFAFAPIACWTALRGTVGQPRRRGIVAGLAAFVPVLVIIWCVTLGGLGSALALGDDATTTALFVGFSLATAGCAVLSVGALGDAGSVLLRRAVVVGLMRAMVVGLVVLVASGVALGSTALLPTREAAVLVAVALTILLGWCAIRLFGWAADVVDPAAELRLELDRAAAVVVGRHREVARSVVRRLAEDHDLDLAFAVAAGTWVDAAGQVTRWEPDEGVGLARDEGGEVVVLVSAQAPARDHARAWGDCSLLLRPALMEAREAWQAGRAAVAAEEERTRLQQDLHDGLQGRLLGLALNLQLSQSGTDDPVARLAIEETVSGLRSAVQDVRAMADGRLPQILVDDGLEAAVRALLQPVRARIGTLDLAADPAGRRPLPAIEACAYYVVGEAVGNAVKHARCDRIDVSLAWREGSVVVRVVDDGDGGADLRLGSGLRGLAERVEAHGGLLVVSDGEASGTLVEAVLPCGW